MKKLLFGLIIGVLAGGAIVWLVAGHHGPAKEEEKEKEHAENSHLVHETNGETFLKFDQEAQQHMGLKSVPVEAMQLKPEVKAFGRVLDPASLAVSMTDIASARAQLEASGKEAARLKLLHEQNQNASTRALETAEAILQRDKIALHAAELKLLASWGSEFVKRPDLDSFIHALVAQEFALVRIDVPAAEKLEGTPTSARVRLLSAPDSVIPAEFVSATVASDPQTPGRGYLFLLKTNSIPANSVVTAWLSVPGEAEQGVVVPREAILRHEGEAFVFVQSGADQFMRHEIELEHPVAQGWFVEKLKPGTKVVVTGAQQLLSEEFKGEGGGE